MYDHVWDELPLQLDDVWQHVQLLRSRVSLWASAQAQIWMKRRLPKGRGSTAQLENKSCVCSVVVSRAGSHIFRRCFYSSDEVAWSPSAPQVGILYMCCTRCGCFSPMLLRSFCAETCVSVANVVSLYMFVCFGCFEQIDGVSTNFRPVIVLAFGVF